MPEDNLNDVARWRSLAAEALTLAAQMSDPASKLAMLNIALGYEHIAQRAERRLNAAMVGPLDDGANGLATLLPLVLPLLNCTWALISPYIPEQVLSRLIKSCRRSLG